MINLTPDEVKQNTIYAKRNSRLLKYAMISGFTMLCILLVTGVTILDMTKTKTDLDSQLGDQSSKISGYKGVEQKGQALFDQVTTIKELLTRQVKFSELFPDFAKILPPGSIILSLDFNSKDFTGETQAGQKAVKPEEKPFVIRAATVDSQTASTLLENIKARDDLFLGADIIDVVKLEPSTGGENQIASKYPYQVTINAYLKPGSLKQPNKSSSVNTTDLYAFNREFGL